MEMGGTRPVAVITRLHKLFVARLSDGGMRTDLAMHARLPILLDEAFAAFGQCTKLQSTQFPFPWAQVGGEAAGRGGEASPLPWLGHVRCVCLVGQPSPPWR